MHNLASLSPTKIVVVDPLSSVEQCRSTGLRCTAAVASVWLALGGGKIGCCVVHSLLETYFGCWSEKRASAFVDNFRTILCITGGLRRIVVVIY